MIHSRRRDIFRKGMSILALFLLYPKKTFSSQRDTESAKTALDCEPHKHCDKRNTEIGKSSLNFCSDIKELKSIIGENGDVIFLAPRSAIKNIGGGYLSWVDDVDTESDDVVFFRVNMFGGWVRDYSNGILANWVGDITDGTDASEKMNILSGVVAKYKSKLILPSGVIRLSNPWILNHADDLVVIGQGMANTIIYGDSSSSEPIISIRKDGWITNKLSPGPRTRNVTLRDFCITGALEKQTENQSNRDGLFLGGVGFDFEIGYLWFYRLGRRAIVAEDLWDGDIHNCKIHEVGKSKSFKSFQIQAFTFLRKFDSCNAIRITNNHFEHLKLGALYIQDYCHSFYLNNNKFESINADFSYSKTIPIYVGKNHRNFSWFGGFCVLNNQNKIAPFAYIHGDSTRLIGVSFVTPNKNDGASILDIGPGVSGVGAVVQCHFDVRGDLFNKSGEPIYPIKSSGASIFAGSTFKLLNPGSLFKLDGKGNDINNISVVGIGNTIKDSSLISQSSDNNKVNAFSYSGVPYFKLSNYND